MTGARILAGRNALITGASRGLGEQIARAFWQQGSSLFLAARDRVALEKIRDSLTPSGDREQEVFIYTCDLAEPASVSGLLENLREVFSFVSVLVNNAAMIGPIGLAIENDWQEWQKTIQVNLIAAAELSAKCAAWMNQRAYGKIINISGGGATGPRPRMSAYAAAKTALVRFSEVLSGEVKETHIDVNCIAPGVMKTAMLERILSEAPERLGPEYETLQRKLLQGEGDTSQAVALAVFLASGASDGITGRLISARWDFWEGLAARSHDLEESDIYTLRRIVPKDRGRDW